MASMEFNKGFAAGWLAASQAILNAMGEERAMPSAPSVEMAGNLPTIRRRGRPPKSASALAPAKRGAGRPRKTT